MKGFVILMSSGGELDRIEVKGKEKDEGFSKACHEAIHNSGWRLDPGDTIKIVQS